MISIPFEIKLDEDAWLRGNLFPSGQVNSKGTCIISHGYKGFKDWGMFPYSAAWLAKCGLDVITFNFSHNGIGDDPLEFTQLDRFARNTYSREIHELTTLLSMVRAGSLPIEGESPNRQRVFLLGHSRGAAVSLLAALDHPELVDGIVGWNASLDVDIFSAQEKEEMRTKGRAFTFNARTKQQMPLDVVILEDMERNQARFDILERIDALEVPLALIQGSEDFPRLLKLNAQLAARRPDVSYIVIPGGNHTFLAVHPFQGTTEPLEAALKETLEWLENVNNL